MIRKRTFKGKKNSFGDYKITLKPGGNYASVTKQICHKSLYKRTAGSEPQLRDCSYSPFICFANSTLLLPCSISNWHSDPSDNSTSATRMHLGNALFPPGGVQGTLFTDRQDSCVPLWTHLPELNRDKTFASQYEKLSHLHIRNSIIFNRCKIMDGRRTGQ